MTKTPTQLLKEELQAEFETEQDIEISCQKMANIFLEKIDIGDFVTWLLEVTTLLYKDEEKSVDDTNEHALDFCTSFGYCLIPEFLKAETKEEKIEALKNYLPDIYRSTGDAQRPKEYLAYIGRLFLHNYTELKNSSEGTARQFDILSALMSISQEFEQFEFFEETKRDRENKIQKAA